MSKTLILPHSVPVFGDRVITKQMPGKAAVVNIYSGTDQRLRGAAIESDKTDIDSAFEEGPVDTAPSEAAIRKQLACMLRSSVFIQSERLSRFLRFIVEHAIAGNQNYLKEYVIGSEVYDRKPPYHPSQDSIVRTEARRLRNKLKDYYENEGRKDPVHVYLRIGSYIPVFQPKASFAGAQNALLVNSAPSLVVAIFPFDDISGTLLSSKCSRGIPDELAYTLLRAYKCRVISPVSTSHLSAQPTCVPSAMSQVGAQVAFEGSVREEGNHLRVTARIVDAAGFHLWATRVDADTAAHSMFAIEEQIAAALSAGYNALFGASPC